MPTVNVFRVRAALGLPRREAALIAFVLLVVQKMTNNPNFPSPGTVVTALATAAATYQVAVQTMSTSKGVGDARTAARQALVDRLVQVQAYLNGVVAALPPDQAQAAIESSGFSSKKRGTFVKPPLAVKYGGLAGAVLVVARTVDRNAVYYFEYSADGQHWTTCPSSMRCQVSVSSLTVGTTYSFRFHAQTRKGLTELSQVVTFVVR